MDYLSLFSGAAGGDLGLQHLLGWRCRGYVEWDKYCCRVLEQRIKDGLLSDAPIFCSDIRQWIANGYAASYTGLVDCVTGGPPCQPFSVAGKQAGADDPRNMWPATIECLRIIRPRFAFLENVPGILVSGYFGTILGDLAESGYDARWRILSAAEVGAPHKRNRLWLVAHHNVPDTRSAGAWMGGGRDSRSCRQEWSSANASEPTLVRQGNGADSAEGIGTSSNDVADAQSKQDGRLQQPRVRPDSESGRISMADATIKGLEGQQRAQPKGSGVRSTYSHWWESERGLDRLAHGIPNRVDRLKAAGNGQVPLCAALAFLLLAGNES